MRATIENQAIEGCPKGMTTTAARSGPMALPPLPPTWKMDWANPFFPPAAICAMRDASGWNIDEPHPITPTATRISE